MRAPLRWIREFIDVSATADEIAHRLTMAGTEVGSIVRIGAEWESIVIGRIDEIGKHEGADNLFVARVDVGTEHLTLVTAASNLVKGSVVPVVRAGGHLVRDRTVDARRFRGILSEGMLCSGAELGVSADADTIYVLESEAPIGVDLRDYLGDEVLDIELTPNRPDCLGIVGIAREIAALTGASLRLSEEVAGLMGPLLSDGLDRTAVYVEDGTLCPRYTAVEIAGLQVAPSPAWLQRRLFFCGVRTVNNVVDVTNYVMIECGQPLHAFDADKIRGSTIRVRRSREGETLTTIDGVERVLPSGALVIADNERPIALAGIMGGIDSEISEATTRVVLESATFDATSIRRTSRQLRLTTEASKRFDKGLDVDLPPAASVRAVSMIAQLAPSVAHSEIYDVRDRPAGARVIPFTLGDIAGLIGQDYPQEQVTGVLRSLGFEVQVGDDQLQALVPSWRGDVEGKADLAEEVARVVGYDAVPTRLPSGALPRPADDPALWWDDELRTRLAAAGLQEVMTYSLIEPYAISRLDVAKPFPPNAPDDDLIPVTNPMSVEQSRLRSTLLPGILGTVASNLRFQTRVAIFEAARVFHRPLDPLPREERRLAMALAGRRAPDGWNTGDEAFDFYDLVGVVGAVFEGLQLEWFPIASSSIPWAHPGRGAAAHIRDDSEPIALMGQVHPLVAERFGMTNVEVYAAEIALDRLLGLARQETTILPIPRFPAVERDLAIVVDERIAQQEVAAIIRSTAGTLLDRLALFDVYRGPPVPSGQVSLAFSLAFRSPSRTLADDEVASVLEQIEREMSARLGATIRGR